MSLHIFYDNKFKTSAISLNFIQKLDKSSATVNALLPLVIKRASSHYPTTISLQKKLKELYGAELNAGIIKRGDYQIINFRFDFISESYAKNIDIFKEISKILEDVVFNQSSFNNEYFNQEKENLKLYIASLKNDKRSYAIRRLQEIMFAEQPYAICEEGFEDDVDKITIRDLTASYKKMLSSPLEIFVTGNVDQSDAEGILLPENYFGFSESFESINNKAESAEVTEYEQISQSKLSMGFLTSIESTSPKSSALSLYNGIFGGGAYSKLFNNVREKLSLAYYAGSRVDRFKGAIFVNAGIDKANKDLAVREILNQHQDIIDGKFSESDVEAAKLSRIMMLNSIQDSQIAIEDYYLKQILSGRGTSENIATAIELTNKVQSSDIIDAAKTIEYKSQYFLTNGE